jgi:2-polyprenyl-3-methyl-5-hydroxy-6-metoxy-1,4-benzoquinol methylase
MSRAQHLAESEVPEQLMQGHYARKQLGSRSRIIAWSHRRRLRMAARLAAPYAGQPLLDYGCGDGTFLAQISPLFPDVTGADADAGQIDECRKRFANLSRVSFIATRDLAGSNYDRRFGLICCMEVFEHCVDADVDYLLEDLDRLLAPGGAIIISVPIEIGPALIGKELLRAIAGRRRIGDYQYRDSYRWGELMRMACAGAATVIARPTHPFGTGAAHSHKGFNWRRLRSPIERRFVIRDVHFSPFDGFAGWLSSQVWFRCERSP